MKTRETKTFFSLLLLLLLLLFVLLNTQHIFINYFHVLDDVDTIISKKSRGNYQN